MIIYYLLVIGIVVALGIPLYKWFLKNWKKAEIKDKIDDLEIENKVFQKAKYVDKKDVKRKRQKIEQVKNL